MDLESEFIALCHTEDTVLHRDGPTTGYVLVILVAIIFKVGWKFNLHVRLPTEKRKRRRTRQDPIGKDKPPGVITPCDVGIPETPRVACQQTCKTCNVAIKIGLLVKISLQLNLLSGRFLIQQSHILIRDCPSSNDEQKA